MNAVTILPVRRTIAVVVLVAIVGVAGALAYSALANEREFDRLMADGDAAMAGGPSTASPSCSRTTWRPPIGCRPRPGRWSRRCPTFW